MGANKTAHYVGTCYFCGKPLGILDEYMALKGPDGDWIRGCSHHPGVLDEVERQSEEEPAAPNMARVS